MHIISQYKDYYDYLQGQYGKDEKVTLDRRDFMRVNPYDYEFTGNYMLSICIGGFEIQGVRKDGKFYYAEHTDPLANEISGWSESWEARKGRTKDKFNWITLEKGSRSWDGYTAVIKREITPTDINDKLNCPIVFAMVRSRHGELKPESYRKFPILRQFDLVSILPPEKVWFMLYDWLSKDRVQNIALTDKQKIEAHGFDPKKSFRHRK